MYSISSCRVLTASSLLRVVTCSAQKDICNIMRAEFIRMYILTQEEREERKKVRAVCKCVGDVCVCVLLGKGGGGETGGVRGWSMLSDSLLRPCRKKIWCNNHYLLSANWRYCCNEAASRNIENLFIHSPHAHMDSV